MKTNNKPLIFAARTKNRDLLSVSSSGGVFTILSDYFLDRGGAVCCCIYDYNKNLPIFQIITDKLEIDKARGSKYITSKLGDCFRECEKWLYNNPEKELMFIGTGCQADGFKQYISNDSSRNRAFIVDLICYGLPSSLVWTEFLHKINCDNQPIEHISFKDKRIDWQHPTAYIKTNKREVDIQKYVNLYYSRYVLRPSCYECPYTAVERNTDITIGDYWGIEKVHPDFYDRLGNSLLILHTEKATAVFEIIRNSLDTFPSNVSECLQPALIHPVQRPVDREFFWKDFRRRGINYILTAYGNKKNIPLYIRIFHKMRRKCLCKK